MMNSIIFVGSFPSLKYLDFISVRQIEDMYIGSPLSI